MFIGVLCIETFFCLLVNRYFRIRGHGTQFGRLKAAMPFHVICALTVAAALCVSRCMFQRQYCGYSI